MGQESIGKRATAINNCWRSHQWSPDGYFLIELWGYEARCSFVPDRFRNTARAYNMFWSYRHKCGKTKYDPAWSFLVGGGLALSAFIYWYLSSPLAVSAHPCSNISQQNTLHRICVFNKSLSTLNNVVAKIVSTTPIPPEWNEQNYEVLLHFTGAGSENLTSSGDISRRTKEHWDVAEVTTAGRLHIYHVNEGDIPSFVTMKSYCMEIEVRPEDGFLSRIFVLIGMNSLDKFSMREVPNCSKTGDPILPLPTTQVK